MQKEKEFQCYKKSGLLLLMMICVGLAFGEETAVTTISSPLLLEPSLRVHTPVNTRNAGDGDLAALCPNMVRYVFESAMPRDEFKAGVFEKYPPDANDRTEEEVDLRLCIEGCCEKGRNNTCNVVFMYKRKCYHVKCVSNEACLPKERRSLTERVQMVLVNPVSKAHDHKKESSWLDLLKGSKNLNEMLTVDEADENINSLNFWKQPHKINYFTRSGPESSNYDDDDSFPLAEKRMKQLFLSSPIDDNSGTLPEDMTYYRSNFSPDTGSMANYITCSLDVGSGNEGRCPLNEVCAAVRADVNTGICKCSRGYVRNHLRVCVSDSMDYSLIDESGSTHNLMVEAGSSNEATTQLKSDSEPTPKTESNKKLMVSVVSKEVRLPEKEVTLAAFTVPDEESSNTKYKYLWTLINQPKSPMNGTISDQSQSKVKLSNLSEGLYTFKVTVTGDGTFGEAMANVTVLPEKRINRVPQVIITPKEQIIRQPTTNAILDGSRSTDDDKIVSWHWEVVSGPIGYQPKLPEVNTLQLTDLKSPGNYTFKLTVTDTDNVTNFTTATITVLKGTDYPPVANAGDAVILYLPNNNVTLNGTASSDDHEIVAWEWTKDASDEAKAVDMQNTRTPYVQLSNLEEGMYTFVLKVTDGSGQSSTAKVHVFVKPPTNSPPVAVVGTNMTINLPTNWVMLNGSGSSDDIGIRTYNWREITGPNKATILNSNDSIANATGLTLGLYEFELIVSDESNNTAASCMWIKVVQEKNSAPVANAGGDQSITLPVSAIFFNGSLSSDDLGIVKYKWTREDASLAVGQVVGDSDNGPVMILTNLVSGRYVFKLTVSDEQGLSSSDTASVFIHPDPMLLHLIQLTLPTNISMLTHSALNTIVQKIGLLLGDMKIEVRELQHDLKTNAAILIFYVQLEDGGKNQPMDGLVIEHLLKDKLQRDASILGTVFADVRTVICQNKCSNHGVCNDDTRSCLCEAFWMPSLGYFLGYEEANCDWSVLYVFVGVIVLFLLLSALFWAIAMACRQSKKPRSRPKVQKYSLIGTQDEESQNYGRATSLTDSETDSDVLFESRSKSNGNLRLNGTCKNKQNGHDRGKYPGKHGRKVKT